MDQAFHAATSGGESRRSSCANGCSSRAAAGSGRSTPQQPGRLPLQQSQILTGPSARIEMAVWRPESTSSAPSCASPARPPSNRATPGNPGRQRRSRHRTGPQPRARRSRPAPASDRHIAKRSSLCPRSETSLSLMLVTLAAPIEHGQSHELRPSRAVRRISTKAQLETAALDHEADSRLVVPLDSRAEVDEETFASEIKAGFTGSVSRPSNVVQSGQFASQTSRRGRVGTGRGTGPGVTGRPPI